MSVLQGMSRIRSTKAHTFFDSQTGTPDGIGMTLAGAADAVAIDVRGSASFRLRCAIQSSDTSPFGASQSTVVRAFSVADGQWTESIEKDGHYIVPTPGAGRLFARLFANSGTITVTGRALLGVSLPPPIGSYMNSPHLLLDEASSQSDTYQGLDLMGGVDAVVVDVRGTASDFALVARVSALPGIFGVPTTAFAPMYSIDHGRAVDSITEYGQYIVQTPGAWRLFLRFSTTPSSGHVSATVNHARGGASVVAQAVTRNVKPRIVRRDGAIDASSYETIMTVNKSCWIERFEVIGDHELGGVEVIQDDMSWTMLTTTSSGTVAQNMITFEHVRDFGDAQFELTHQDLGLYKMGLRDRVFVPVGDSTTFFRVRNGHTDPINLRAYLRITEVY